MDMHLSHAVSDAHGSGFRDELLGILSGPNAECPIECAYVDAVTKNGAPAISITGRGYSPSLHSCRFEAVLAGGSAARTAVGEDERDALILEQISARLTRQHARRLAAQALGASRQLPAGDPWALKTSHLRIDAAMVAAAALGRVDVGRLVRESVHRAHGGSSPHAGGAHLDTRHGSIAEEGWAGDGPHPPGTAASDAFGEPLRTAAAGVAIRLGDALVATVRGRGVRLSTALPESVLPSLPGMRLGELARLHPLLDASIIESAVLVGDVGGHDPNKPAGLQVRLAPAPLPWTDAIAIR